MDSIGINEQELSFLSHVAGGPYMEEYPTQSGTTHPHKVFPSFFLVLFRLKIKKTSILGSRDALLVDEDLRKGYKGSKLKKCEI